MYFRKHPGEQDERAQRRPTKTGYLFDMTLNTVLYSTTNSRETSFMSAQSEPTQPEPTRIYFDQHPTTSSIVYCRNWK
jgi:hypothetical protein